MLCIKNKIKREGKGVWKFTLVWFKHTRIFTLSYLVYGSNRAENNWFCLVFSKFLKTLKEF